MVRNALRRDAENGFVIRGEMLVELEKSCVGLEPPTQKEEEEVVEFICYDAQHNVWLKRGDTGSVTRKIQDAQHWPTKIAAAEELRRRALPDDEWMIQSVRYVVKPEEGTPCT
jgi:CO dehydrogenase/acetyl-CoA synthase alpha subunit